MKVLRNPETSNIELTRELIVSIARDQQAEAICGAFTRLDGQSGEHHNG
jgi:hypothetical protein